MSDIGELGLDVTQFNQGIDRVVAKLEELNTATKKTDEEVKGLGSSMKNFFSFLTVGAIVAFTKSIITMSGAVADQAAALNLDAEAVQELNYAFGQSGAKAADVSTSITKLNQSVQSAREGNTKMIESFEKLGITWEDLNTLSPDRLLMKIADGSKNATDKVEALDAIVEVLGKSGKKMAAGLSEGSDAVQKLRDEASKLTNDQIDKLDALGDAWERLTLSVKVYAANVALALKEGPIPFIRALIGQDDPSDTPMNNAVAGSQIGLALGAISKPPVPKPIPEDPRVAAENKRIDDMMRKGAEEFAKADEKARKETEADLKEEGRRNEALGKQEAKELDAQNRKANEDAKREARLRAIANQNSANARREEIHADIGDVVNRSDAEELRIREGFNERRKQYAEEGNQDAIDQLDRQEEQAIRPARAARGRETPASRRAERKAHDDETRAIRRADQRDKDIADRAARGAHGREIDRLQNKGNILDKIKQDAAASAAAAKEEVGWTQGDADNLASIAAALQNDP